MLATRRDVAYGLVIIWALIGIAVNQGGNQSIVMLAEIGAIVVTIAEKYAHKRRIICISFYKNAYEKCVKETYTSRITREKSECPTSRKSRLKASNRSVHKR